jgi:hypothetical protein
MKKLLVLLLSIIVVFASCISITPKEPGEVSDGDLPVINFFSSDPGSIAPGDSSTLKWEVSGASSVTIDQDIGSVALGGNRAVSPDMTTVYTLTAVGKGGRVQATAEVVVSAESASEPPPSLPPDETPEPPPEEAPPPVPTEAPTIVAFDVSPDGIDSGEDATLLWNVTGADSVSIDNGVGDVAPAGTATVSPATTTTYTLTATNAAGTETATAELGVTIIFVPIGPIMKIVIPDIAVTNVKRKAGPDSYLIEYTVENIGTGTVPASKTKLYANGNYKSTDAVPELAPDDTHTGTFSWKYDPTTPQIKVVADTTDVANEFNEDNNEKSVNYGVQVWMNYVDKAAQASWSSGAGSLSFGGSTSDHDGFATYRTNIVLEDGHTYSKILETHPQWVDDGYIWGWYPTMEIPFATKFSAKVGFIKGASGTDGAKIYVFFWEEGSFLPTNLGTIEASYNSNLDTFNISLFDKAGKKGRIGLGVNANGTSGKDWVAWTSARLIR